MKNKERFLQAAELVVDEQTPPEEQLWLRSMISDLGKLVEMSEQQQEEMADLNRRMAELTPSEESLLRRRLMEDLNQLVGEEIDKLQEEIEEPEADLEAEDPYTITAPSCLSKGGLLDMAKVLNALPSQAEIRVELDLSEATGLTYIAAGAFTHCEALQSVKLPPSVIEIGHHAFDECVNLESVDIPEGVTTIEAGAFAGCSSLESVDIPASVTTIGEYAFSGCDELGSVDIPDGVTTTINNEEKFMQSAGLVVDELTLSEKSLLRRRMMRLFGISEEQEEIDDELKERYWLRLLIFNLWQRVGISEDYQVLEEMKALERRLDEGLVSIERSLERLREMSEQHQELEEQEAAPQEEIDELQEKMEELEADLDLELEEPYSISAPSCLSKGGLSDMAKVLHALPSWPEIRVELDLSEATGLPYIAAGAFTHCEALQSVKLPPSVIEIGPHAFDHCSNLASVDIPEGVTTIEAGAFAGCSSLESVDIPASVTTIGESAFSGCDKLKSLTFQKTDGWCTKKRLYDDNEPPEPIDVSDPKANAENSKLFTSRLIRRTEP